MKSKKLNFFSVFLLFAIIPLLVVTILLSEELIRNFSKKLVSSNGNTMVTLVESIGNSVDASNQTSGTILKNYAASPLVKQVLKNPDNAEYTAQLQAYTEQYYGNLNGWEGIYLCDWNSKVLAHSAAGAVGMVLAEGELYDSYMAGIVGAGTEIFNSGIMQSPASGLWVASMCYTVFDDDGNPLGFVGGATLFGSFTGQFSDISSLGLDSAYIYYVGADGIILSHPTEEKVGEPVENEKIQAVIAQIAEGNHPEAEYVEYKFNGRSKYAAYYVGEMNDYIAVIVADKSEILGEVNKTIIFAIVVAAALLLLSAIAVFLISKKIVKPFAGIVNASKEIAGGNTSVSDGIIKTNIREISDIAIAEDDLKIALSSSVTKIRESASRLDSAIAEVDTQLMENMDSINMINNTISEVAETSQNIATEALNMTDQSMILSDNIDQLSSNIETLKTSASLISKSNDDAAAQMRIVLGSSRESMDAVKDITNRVNETNTAILEIEKCVQMIEAIASQTNLLSLNASIEAARAGEAGKGFAVVADEIRALSDSTAESSGEIKNIIDKVTALSQDTVVSAERVVGITNEEQECIAATQEKFETLSSEVQVSISQIENINLLADSLGNIKESLVTATTQLGSISEQLGASAEEASASCQVVVDSYDETKHNTDNMKQMDAEMIEAISFFK